MQLVQSRLIITLWNHIEHRNDLTLNKWVFNLMVLVVVVAERRGRGCLAPMHFGLMWPVEISTILKKALAVPYHSHMAGKCHTLGLCEGNVKESTTGKLWQTQLWNQLLWGANYVNSLSAISLFRWASLGFIEKFTKLRCQIYQRAFLIAARKLLSFCWIIYKLEDAVANKIRYPTYY